MRIRVLLDRRPYDVGSDAEPWWLDANTDLSLADFLDHCHQGRLIRLDPDPVLGTSTAPKFRDWLNPARIVEVRTWEK